LGRESGVTAALQAEIKTLLDETAAYRHFFRSAEVKMLGF